MYQKYEMHSGEKKENRTDMGPRLLILRKLKEYSNTGMVLLRKTECKKRLPEQTALFIKF